MSKMIQIRNVPDKLHRKFKVRAAKAGMSLSDYLLAELRYLADLPTQQEWLEELDTDEPVDLGDFDVVETLREDRESH